jgi:glucokinase
MRRVLAVDLGGTKISAAVVDSEGNIHDKRKAAIDKQNTVAQIADLAGQNAEIDAIGVVVPGIYFAGTGKVWAPNLFGPGQFPLRGELQSRFGAPIVLDSDRAAYVLGEQWLGVARGLSDVVFLAVGTGIGAGIITGGRLCRGAGDIAGAVGWFAVDRNQKEIYRRMGCLEAEAAGPAVERRAGMPPERVVEAARNNDAAARRVLNETAAYLAMGVANIVSILNPSMVVLGGGLMQAGDLLLEPIRREVVEWAQPIAAQQVRIELTQLGEDAGLLGAARLALQE